MYFVKGFVFFAFILLAKYVTSNEKIVLCYYGTWATYRYGLGKFDVDHINTELCTHLVYTFVGITAQGNVTSLDPYLDLPDNWGRDNFGKFNALKTRKSGLKTILAVGGWNEGSAKYSVMAADPTLRKNFIYSALDMVLKHGFDGLDVDWEYPNRRDTIKGPADVDNFTQLLRKLREEFDKHGLMLTAAVASVEEMASLSYDIPAISKYLDIISIMTYDMYGAWDSVTGHNSPLHKGEGDEDVPKEQIYSVDVALDFWLKQGCPPEKLVVGLPLYGRTFTLTNTNVNGVRAPASGPGIAGPFTVTNGVIGYNEFCDKLRSEQWDVRYDELAQVPYAVQSRNWVSYDNPNSLAVKVKYILNYGIAGIMVWSIETDDFHAICHSEDFPLLRAVNRALGKNLTESTVEVATSTVSSSTDIPSSSNQISTEHTSTNKEQESSVCKEEGLSANPEDCSSFYMCVRNASGVLVALEYKCPGNLLWDENLHICNYAEYVECTV